MCLIMHEGLDDSIAFIQTLYVALDEKYHSSRLQEAETQAQ